MLMDNIAHGSTDLDSMQPTTKRVLAEGKYLRLIAAGHWEYAERTTSRDAVVIVAVTDDRRLILVEQYRIPLNGMVLELPAGLVGDDAGCEGEELISAARRELLEETGFRGQRLEPIASLATSPGLTSETQTFFLATGLIKQSAGGGVDHEQITVHGIPLAELRSFLAERQATHTLSAQVYVALGLLKLAEE